MLIATSWDDGLVTDLRLIKILEKYSATASFALNIELHEKTPTLNDRRYTSYGYRVAIADLNAFAPFDICDHSATHKQMDTVAFADAASDLLIGKNRLEQVFAREIDGIVWPFGISTPATVEFAKQIGHKYGRGTPITSQNLDSWTIIPYGGWRINIEAALSSELSAILLSGHTFEMRTERDWQHVDELYRVLTTDSRAELVNMTELMRRYHA